ncbi:hypothetical protein [Janthinobacterium lividum]|uniref:Apea-like HEPN domain-containing protein n=2 Tax=Janthinobacterium lividum TaxID=29581 RepID=A0ABU0Y0H9_9BURK|nr:hypothetical protein [Janthinobacterium lividum]MDQ4628660.1 hypothetical protein [Janthinobacterium lividum]MDQ4677082.1 hypothetical protein [Janthinobacterium lividum]MDQ4687619.1 hypothetical protein [Janthinobacterium lividum]
MISHNLKILGTFHMANDETEDGNYFLLNSEIWAALPKNISRRVYFHEGVEIVVSANWNSAVMISAEVNRITKNSIAASGDGLFEWLEPFPSNLEVPVNVVMSGENNLLNLDWYPIFFVDNYLYDVFMMLNLALPGSADFMNLRIQSDTSETPTLPTRLSPYYFHAAYSERDEWPFLSEVGIETIEKWYSDVRKNVSQIPESPLERALFSVLHVCRSDGRPEDIIWIFHALESLLQTRVGENFSALVERLTLVLSPDAKQESVMKKKLREMYSHRSSFVHGGLAIIHPMHNEVIDCRAGDAYISTIELSKYGIKLLLACFQNFARNGWLNVSFRVVLEGG